MESRVGLMLSYKEPGEGNQTPGGSTPQLGGNSLPVPWSLLHIDNSSDQRAPEVRTVRSSHPGHPSAQCSINIHQYYTSVKKNKLNH